jgi:hypothetical protein
VTVLITTASSPPDMKDTNMRIIAAWDTILISENLGLDDRKHGGFQRHIVACIDCKCAIDP